MISKNEKMMADGTISYGATVYMERERERMCLCETRENRRHPTTDMCYYIELERRRRRTNRLRKGVVIYILSLFLIQ
jgi:hypothetical protein